jgi:hypothetical protein
MLVARVSPQRGAQLNIIGFFIEKMYKKGSEKHKEKGGKRK